MADPTTIIIDHIDNELITVALSEIDLISGIPFEVTSPQNDDILIYRDGKWINTTISVLVDTYAIHNETPTAINPLPSTLFETAFAYRSETLQVFLNGQKIHDSEITQISDIRFDYPLSIITSDKIEVSYIKK